MSDTETKKAIKAARDKLIKARNVYKEAENERNALIHSLYVEGKSVTELAINFGMKEANVSKTIALIHNRGGRMPIQNGSGLNMSL